MYNEIQRCYALVVNCNYISKLREKYINLHILTLRGLVFAVYNSVINYRMPILAIPRGIIPADRNWLVVTSRDRNVGIL